MEFISVADAAKRWEISERSVRNYCAIEKIPGAYLQGKTWKIPVDAISPAKNNKSTETLLDILLYEKKAKIKNGAYENLLVDFTYNSNMLSNVNIGNSLVRHMVEFKTVRTTNYDLKIDDIVETANHFKCIDLCIKNAKYQLTENFIRQLVVTLKNGTEDSREDWFMAETYKKLPKDIGSILSEYNALENVSLENILYFHSKFEKLYPFKTKDKRIGALIVLKECLKNNIRPFMIEYEKSNEYYELLNNPTSNMVSLCARCNKAQSKFENTIKCTHFVNK